MTSPPEGDIVSAIESDRSEDNLRFEIGSACKHHVEHYLNTWYSDTNVLDDADTAVYLSHWHSVLYMPLPSIFTARELNAGTDASLAGQPSFDRVATTMSKFFSEQIFSRGQPVFRIRISPPYTEFDYPLHPRLTANDLIQHLVSIIPERGGATVFSSCSFAPPM